MKYNPARAGSSAARRRFRAIIRAIAADGAGSFYIDALIGFMVFIAVTMSFLTVPEILIKKQALDHIAKTAVRRIERDGMAGAGLYKALIELENETGLSADVSWSGPFQNADAKIQIRDRFTVSAIYTVRIKLFEPSFASPVFLDIPIRKTLSGVSEVYWKELA